MLPASPSEEKKAGLAYWANRVLEECDKASVDFAADPVHDLRVAIRRCRSMADGFISTDADRAWKQMKRLAKPLFSSLGELRDVQVMLEWVAKLSHPDDAVGASLSAALGLKETELKAAAQQALISFDREHWASLNTHLAQRVDRIPMEGLVFQHLALERWVEARELHRRALRNRSGAAYHQLRVGIKRFRYTVENFLPERHNRWSKDLRGLQDALGEVHDFDVLRAMIRAHSELPDDERQSWYDRISEERQKRLDLYRCKMIGKRSLWEVWRSELPHGPLLEQAGMEKLRTWAASLDPDPPHSARVTRFALELYDQLCEGGNLAAGTAQRRILEAAAILHEVGRTKTANGPGGHQKRGYKIVSKLTPPLGWSARDIHSIAILVRYHRGALPVTSNSSFVGLTAKQRKDLLPLIGILRLANAFDSDHEENISSIKAGRHNGELVVYAEGLRPISRQAEAIAQARYLLEMTSRQPITIRPLRGTAASRPRKTKSRSATVAAH